MKFHIRFAAPLFAVIVIIATYWPTMHFFSNQYDDSYITYRYAINLAEGHGLTFNAGERTDAASSFLYTIALSIFWLLGIKNLEFVGGLLGLISLAVICLYVYKTAKHLKANEASSIIVSAACGLNGFLSGWALSGMETMPWAALVLVSIYLILSEANSLVTALTIAAAAFTRFEGILLIAPYGFQLLRQKKPLSSYLPLITVIFAFGGFYAIKHAYYGVWISHAFKMKEIATYYQAAPGELLKNWRSMGAIPLMIGTLGLIGRSHLPIISYMLLSALSVILGPKSDWSRYSVHLLPIFYVYTAVCVSQFQLTLSKKASSITLAIVAALMLAQSAKGYAFNWKNMTELARHQVCRRHLGEFIHTHIPQTDYIASSDLGIISYAAINHRFVDLIALTSSDVLEKYSQGETADAVLTQKQVKYLADTFPADEKNRFNTLLAQFPNILERSHFRILDEEPMYRCSANGKLDFRLTKILNPDATPNQIR